MTQPVVLQLALWKGKLAEVAVGLQRKTIAPGCSLHLTNVLMKTQLELMASEPQRESMTESQKMMQEHWTQALVLGLAQQEFPALVVEAKALLPRKARLWCTE